MTSQDLTLRSSPLPDRMRYAEALSQSGLLPDVHKRNPANVLVAIEYGNALGLAPMVAISEINVIKGTPSLSAAMMAALARQAGHRVRTTGDAETATCTIVRADDPEYEHTATWTRQKAQDAGLWGRGHWAKDPATMLKWRAISEAVRFACPEVLGGLKYTPEEVMDFKTPPGPHTDIPVAVVVEGGDMITDAQLVKLNACASEIGLTRDEKLAGIAHHIGRQVESSRDITKREARVVIDALERKLAETPAPVVPGSVTDAEPADEAIEAEVEWPEVAGVQDALIGGDSA